MLKAKDLQMTVCVIYVNLVFEVVILLKDRRYNVSCPWIPAEIEWQTKAHAPFFHSVNETRLHMVTA
jgi:hypothetical protein